MWDINSLRRLHCRGRWGHSDWQGWGWCLYGCICHGGCCEASRSQVTTLLSEKGEEKHHVAPTIIKSISFLQSAHRSHKTKNHGRGEAVLQIPPNIHLATSSLKTKGIHSCSIKYLLSGMSEASVVTPIHHPWAQGLLHPALFHRLRHPQHLQCGGRHLQTPSGGGDLRSGGKLDRLSVCRQYWKKFGRKEFLSFPVILTKKQLLKGICCVTVKLHVKEVKQKMCPF